MSFDLQIKDGDLTIGPNGDLQQVVNTNKLVQDIIKMVTTQIGSNMYHPWYGSPITKALIGNVLDEQFVSSIATNQLNSALQILQNLQAQQALIQNISPSEQIAAVKQINVQRNASDPRYYTVEITIVSKDLTTTSTQFDIMPTI
jgi:hypothetical protein